ncbi:MAG: glycosyltransferase [Candidatus Zixiibacteriota bacterium]|nr:MAG: glycosyltransferase [candidate division Zixibacteria bacterium]
MSPIRMHCVNFCCDWTDPRLNREKRELVSWPPGCRGKMKPKVLLQRYPLPRPGNVSGRQKPAGPVRVCHLTTVHPFDDSRISHRECLTLARAGFDVTLLAANVLAEPPETLAPIHIATFRVPRRRLFRMLFGGAAALRASLRTRYDIYHLHDPELIPVGLVLRLLGRTVVYDAHEDLPDQILQKKYLKRAVRRLFYLISATLLPAAGRCFTGIVAATPKVGARFVGANLVVIRNYPDVPDEKPVQKPDETIQILYVGGLSEIRGAREMVAAFREATFHRPVRLILAGDCDDPKLQDEIEDAARQHSQISVLGRVEYDRVTELLRESHIGLCLLYPTPNHVDALPVKFFEYLGYGLAVVASTGLTEVERVTKKWSCAMLVAPESPREIAEALMKLVHDDALRLRLAQNGREAFLHDYNWTKEGARLVKFYQSLLSETDTESV